MMSARERILSNIRRAASGRRRGAAGEVMAPANIVPADMGARTAMFVRMAEISGARVITVLGSGSSDAFAEALQPFSPLRIPDAGLGAMLRGAAPGAIDPQSQTTLARAHAALAETGTVCLYDEGVASEDYFLCEQLLILLRPEDIFSYQEEYWQSRTGRAPRAVHLVTGPSRTADVEQTLQIGAHGPKSVIILLCLPR